MTPSDSGTGSSAFLFQPEQLVPFQQAWDLQRCWQERMLTESETEAEEDLAASREPSVEEQKVMWGGSSGTLSNTQPMAIGDIASGMSGASSPESEATSLEISEEEFSELLSQPSPSEPSGSLAADLLSAFEDEDDAPESLGNDLFSIPS